MIEIDMHEMMEELQDFAEESNCTIEFDWDEEIPLSLYAEDDATTQFFEQDVKTIALKESTKSIQLKLMESSNNQVRLEFKIQPEYKQFHFTALPPNMKLLDLQGCSKFEIVLQKSHEKASQVVVPSLQSTPERDLQGMKILLVEDNFVNQKVATKFLEKWNTQVALANNGQEGFEKAEAERFDAILMDIQMPVLDGYQATKKIREAADAPSQNTPIIAITASIWGNAYERLKDLGMNDYIVKPFKPDTLYNTLSRYAPQ